MSHYFTDNQLEAHNRKELSFRFLDIKYTFVTDKAVFSPNEIDGGGISLVEAVLQENLKGPYLDLGCGYGNVAIIINSETKESVEGVDINSRAVDLALENNRINKTNCRFYVSDGFSQVSSQFQTILFNPPIHAGKDVYYPLFDQAKNYLLEKGQLVVVMRKNHGLKSAMKYCETLYSKVSIVYKNKGYFVYMCEK